MRKLTLFLLSGAALLVVACRTNESPERQVDDAEITAQVKSKLAADIGLSSVTNISVNSTNGVVTLAGQVDSNAVKAKAEASAKSVPKVVRVIDNLQVVTASGNMRFFHPTYSTVSPRRICASIVSAADRFGSNSELWRRPYT